MIRICEALALALVSSRATFGQNHSPGFPLEVAESDRVSAVCDPPISIATPSFRSSSDLLRHGPAIIQALCIIAVLRLSSGLRAAPSRAVPRPR